MSGKMLLTPSFIRRKRSHPELQEQPSTCGNTDALRPGASRSFDRPNRKDFAVNNEQIIRRAYERAEKVDVKGWVDCFTSDGTFTDMSIGVTSRGPDGR